MSANPRQDGCHGGACKRSADQANDVLSYMATLDAGFRGASAEELGGDIWVPPEWSRGGSEVPEGEGPPVSKPKGCQKQGPGCASASCNECADMAVEVLDYMATLGDGIARATPEGVLESRRGGGFVPGVGAGPGGGVGGEVRQPVDLPPPGLPSWFNGSLCDGGWGSLLLEVFGLLELAEICAEKRCDGFIFIWDAENCTYYDSYCTGCPPQSGPPFFVPTFADPWDDDDDDTGGHHEGNWGAEDA